MKKNKILFIAKNIPVPGIRSSRAIMVIAHELSLFCNISFLYPCEIVPFGFQFLKKYKPFYKLLDWKYEGFNITVTQYIRVPYRRMAFWFWKKLSKKNIDYYLKHGAFDLIHAHYLFPDGYLAFLYFKKFTVPYIITIRNADIIHLKKISKSNPDFKKASLIIYNAQQVLSLNYAYKQFIDKMFCISSVVIPHGIEKEAFKNDSNNKSNTISITAVSEAIKRKNIDWIIKAFKNYKGDKSIELNIIGTGPLIDYYKQIADNDNRINFLGKLERKEVLKYLEYSDIFALPSYSESFGLVYLEAAAMRNAIIGLKDEGVWGVFDNYTEMLFSSNESHFQELLYKLIEDDALRLNLKKQAYKKAMLMDWDNIVLKYKKVYTESINSFAQTFNLAQ